jgi:very-short-patch-repair endonuclease
MSSSTEPTISAEFLQGNVEQGLERIRRRLLDLTNRNRLLSFRHTKKSSLRVVDELPDQLYSELVNGSPMAFRPVPRPRRARALDPGPRPPEDESEAESAARREQAPREPSAVEHAASLGISTFFDLPFAATGPTDSRHQDREIQTLHYPEELESILRTIRSAARLAIEETGTNMLYLAFGFLEWCEGENPRQERLAPLLLLPVSIEKGPADRQTGLYSYTIRYSDEDVVANISLQEKMRQDFSLEIPDVEEDELPESYFRRVQERISGMDRWRIRRHVTLSLLSFGKLLMYRDLDPRTWPAGKSPAAHPRIHDLFHGAERRGGAGIAPDYRLDDPALKSSVPPLVDEADSSQHSALLDALQGMNLVIQGPPGTGKSQTITNLIAAALAQGKNVLFVSEKLAALEVVRHRLNRVGLGDFCLELHSHKTQKKALIEDLRRRLEQSNTYPSPPALDDKLEALERHKQLLGDYVDLINQPFGRLGQTVYDIVWMARRRKSLLSLDVAIVDLLLIPDSEELSFSRLEERRNHICAYATHLATVRQAGDCVHDHPWSGVSHPDLSFLDEQTLLEYLSRVREVSARLEESVHAIGEEIGDVVHPTVVGVRPLIAAIDRVPEPPSTILPGLLPVLREESIRYQLEAFGKQLTTYRGVRDEIIGTNGCIPRIPPADAPGLEAIATEASEWFAQVQRVEDLGRVATGLAESAAALSNVSHGAQEIGRWLGEKIDATPESIPALEALLHLVRSAPIDGLHLRHAGLETEAAIPILRAAVEEVQTLRSKRDALGANLRLELTPSPAEVRQHAAVTASARWWSFVDPKFRAAKRAYLAMSHAATKVTRAQLKEHYQSLAVYQQGLERFQANTSYPNAFGPHGSGIDAPVELLLEVAEWRASILRELVYRSTTGGRLGSGAWSAPTERLRGLARSIEVDATITGSITAARGAVDALPQLVAPGLLPETNAELASFAPVISGAAARARVGAEALAAAGIRPELPIKEVSGLVRRTQEHDRLAEQLGQDEQVARVLGPHFHGTETDFGQILDTFAFYEDLVSSDLPPEVVKWLLADRTIERLQDLRTQAVQLGSDSDELERAFGDFGSYARLTAAWFGSTTAVHGVAFADVRARADKALAARERLPEWLDYLRARRIIARENLQELLGPAEDGNLQPDQLPVAFDFVFANSLVRSIFQRNPALIEFSGLTHEQIRRRFVELDQETIKLTRARIAFQIDQRPIPLGNGSGPVRTHTDLYLLERELAKQKRHVPIRQLVRRAGLALQALKPCFMMGPLSVAQYLAPGELDFDLVVMDEASQLRPEDALGAICRGKQVVVVGDPMQLPPTSFFDRIGDEEMLEEEDDSAQGVAEAESILDVASAAYRPMRMLRWHYRSRHGELIAFSNQQFYDGKLVVFPSPLAKTPELGVKLVHVQDGVYQNRKNVTEARRLVDAALKHMRTRPDESLGVVALNTMQREVIENELEQRLKTDIHGQKYVERHLSSLEPLFVKNLENVQGDERDVIFISITYGPDANGHVYQRFGPINGETGHRRLNVLFTRARKRVVVFSSMLAEHVQLQPGSKPGVAALKGYLAFAQTGVLEQAKFTGREPDSDFEVEVAEALRARGFDVVAQLGVAGYFLDLAVKHPRKPDAYLAAIECDGATYHSSLSARDRDRLRQSILEGLGWNVLRIWSTDWFKNRSAQVDRIVGRLDEILAAEPESPVTSVVDTIVAAPGGNGGSSVGTQRLSPEEARRKLTELRDLRIIKELPLSDPRCCILRDEMIEALLRHRPVDRGEWMDRIPFDLRLDTDGDQLTYLDDVLDILTRVSG